ncbi:hypothetical protein BGX21_000888, partial [Mortierella sp. AD011]
IVTTHEARINCAPHLIDHLDVMAHNVEIKEPRGGRGKSFWEIKYRRNRYKHGVFHAKAYIKKRNMFEKEIQQWKQVNAQLPGEIKELQEKLRKYEEENQGRQAEIKELLEDLEKNQYLLNQVSKEGLDIDIFHELVDTRAYVGDRLENLKAVEKYYMDNRVRLEKQPLFIERVSSNPVDTSIISVDYGNKVADNAAS